MASAAEFPDLIERIITDHARDPVSHGQIALVPVVDRPGGHFLLMAIGWDGYQRIHAPLLHLDVIDERIWVQHDGTERGVAHDLLEGGVREDPTVLAFQHRSRRTFGAFAA